MSAIPPVSAQSNSPLQQGRWYKLGVETTGVHKITYDQLRSMGFDVAKLDPTRIQMFGNKGGMLPQSNAASRPDGLQQIAIYIEGVNDGKFDRSDYILFYGEGADGISFNAQQRVFRYDNNLYADLNYYFITIGEPGTRAASRPSLGGSFAIVDTYNDFRYHEVDSYNDQHSGREWFGEIFGVNTSEYTFTFDIPGITAAAPIKVISSVMGQSYTASSFALELNGVPIGEQALSPIPNTRYGVKGSLRRDTILVDPASVNANTISSQTLKYRFNKGTGSSKAFLNFVLMSFERQLQLYGDQTVFRSAASLANATTTFQITNASAASMVWDITDPYNPIVQDFSRNGATISFSSETTTVREFIAFKTSVLTPRLIEVVANQALTSMSTPNLIIITHPQFKSEAQRLADHRAAFSNWETRVVTTTEVYNEYASGRQDVSAIRDFVRSLWLKNPSSLRAVLLFGKSSFDYKDRIANNLNFVPTYESRNSLHPLQTYSSDDYFGFLESSEGEWSEDPVVNHTMDVAVGRLPVTTLEEAASVVNKIIRYDTDRNNFGSWRKKVVFVADDGNGDDGFTSLHQAQADQLAEFVDAVNPAIETNKLFMGSFPKEVKPTGETSQALRDDILRAFDRGALIINYTGHGNEDQWGDEAVLSPTDIAGLENEVYPFLVTATCEFGRHDDPAKISSAEKTIMHPDGGAIGLVTTARPVNATTNFNLNRAFYQALLTRVGTVYPTIGEVFRRTKNNSLSGVGNRNFSLLADPSMTLALPPDEVHVLSVKTAAGSDTLKALSTVIVKTEIRNANGQKLTEFNGTLEATLFDKEVQVLTTGRNNPQLAYKKWSNALFRGQAKVENGDAEFQFRVPKNISYQIAEGRLSLYAWHDSLYHEAAGYSSAFKIGGTEVNVVTEDNAPDIELFIGDDTFIAGGSTTPDTWLVGKLSDDSGINISAFGIGNSIIGVLDDGAQSFVLNDYYVANVDDPASGWINFPLKNLPIGEHRITVTAWDIFNNSSQSAIDFVVTSEGTLALETFSNFPNPFQEKTTLFFTHNRSGDDLQAQVFIYDRTGEVVKSFEIFVPNSDYQVNIMEFEPRLDIGKKLSAGLYFARVIVRSLSNGSKNEQVTKLILLN